MNKTTLTKYVAGFASVAILLGGFAASASAAGANASANQTAALARVIARSDTAITKRITSLDTLSTKIQALKNVPATEKASIAAEVQTNSSNLTTLKAKIDADTDIATARTDAKTITQDYRIYALIIPQGYVVASSDRIPTIGTMMTTLGAQLQARITAAQIAGKDVTSIQAALNDMSAKVSDANSQAQSAQSGVASLAPDQGNATVAASNKAALVAARANIKTGTQDLKAARADLKTVTQGLRSLHA